MQPWLPLMLLLCHHGAAARGSWSKQPPASHVLYRSFKCICTPCLLWVPASLSAPPVLQIESKRKAEAAARRAAAGPAAGPAPGSQGPAAAAAREVGSTVLRLAGCLAGWWGPCLAPTVPCPSTNPVGNASRWKSTTQHVSGASAISQHVSLPCALDARDALGLLLQAAEFPHKEAISNV